MAPAEAKELSNKVIIKRYPDQYTLIGAPTRVLDLDEAAEALASNTWMVPWMASKIKEALLAGELFQHFKRPDGNWKGRDDGLVSSWKVATTQEVLDYVDTEKLADVSGNRVSKKAQETAYVLYYHEGAKSIELYESLPRQAKVILDILNELNRERYTEASIELILTENAERLKTKQEPMKIFGFYRKRLIDEGHLREE